MLLAQCVLVSLFYAPSNQAVIKWEHVRKGKWDMHAELPVLRGSDRLTKLANQSLQSFERRQFDQFLKTARNDERDFPPGRDMRYFYSSSSAVQIHSTRMISITTSTERYLGGAHGVAMTYTHNFGFVAGKPKRLSIWDVIRPDASTKNELRLLLLGKALKEPYTDWVQDGTKKSFTATELERFWVGKSGLVWEFDPYELGSYASGPFSFTLTWAELAPLMRPENPLAPRQG